MLKLNKKSTWQFIKFSISGAIGTAIDFGVMNLLTIGIGCDKLISQAISFGLAVINNFFFNRYWTFSKSRELSFWQQLVRFVLISVIGLAIRTPLFWLFSKGITLLATRTTISNYKISPEVIGNNFALAICIIIVLLWNYFANRKWTFASEEKINEEN